MAKFRANLLCAAISYVSAVITTGDQSWSRAGLAPTSRIQEISLIGSTVSGSQLQMQDAIRLEHAPSSLAVDAAAEKAIRNLFLRGEFPLADQLAKSQLNSTTLSLEYKNWLRTQLPMIKLGWAWALIRQKNCEEALPLLESTQDQSAQFLSLKGIGYCLLQKKDFAAASSYLERFLEKNKADPEAYILLAEAKESQGEATEALELAQQASALQNLTDDESRELQKREESLNAKAQESSGQTELSSGFIRLRYQVTQHQNLASPAIQILQKTMETLNLQLSLPYPAEPIEVILHQAENFGKIAHSPTWTAGLYDGRVRIPVLEGQGMTEEFARILRHEITHAMLSEHALHRNLPAWFQEGLAQVAECPEFCWHYRFASTSFPFLTSQSFDSGFMRLNRGEAQVAYKQSFYLMQVLYYQFHGIAGIKQIIEQIPLIQDLSSDGLLAQIGQDFSALHQKAQESWLSQRSF